jgi:hypothetical protein
MQCTIHTTLTSMLDSIGRDHALLEVKDAALVIGVTPWWIRQLIAKGDLRAINVGGPEKAARWRIDPEDLNAWMRDRENRPRDFGSSQLRGLPVATIASGRTRVRNIAAASTTHLHRISGAAPRSSDLR